MRFARQHPQLRVIAVASRYAEPRQVAEFVRDRLSGARFTLFLDRNGGIAARLGLVTYPQFLVFGADGRTVGKTVYELDAALALVRPLLRR